MIPTFLFIIFHRCFYLLRQWTSFTLYLLFSLFLYFYLVFLHSLLTDNFSHPPGSMSPCTVSVSAPSINWGHLYVHARTLGPGSARMRIRFGAGCPGQDISECVHYTQPGQYPDIIHPSSLVYHYQAIHRNQKTIFNLINRHFMYFYCTLLLGLGR